MVECGATTPHSNAPRVQAAEAAGTAVAVRRRRNLRWTIVGFSALGLTIAYVDRAALSVAIPLISKEFHIGHAVRGVLLSAFFWSYALFQIPSGRLLDRFGPRVIYPLAVGWWSIWTALTSVTQGMGTLLVFRIGLGIGEAPVQPANVKVVSRWFPRCERAFASSLFDSGQQIGTALSVPLVTALILTVGWRLTFVAIGMAPSRTLPRTGRRGRGPSPRDWSISLPRYRWRCSARCGTATTNPRSGSGNGSGISRSCVREIAPPTTWWW